MALVVTPFSDGVSYRDAAIGKTKKIIKGTMALDNAYPTNGYTVLNSQLGLKTIEQLDVLTQAGYLFQYVSSTGKVKAFNVPVAGNAAVALSEVSANTDLSALNAVGFTAEGLEQS